MPLFHSNGVAAGWAVAIGSGATMVPARFSTSRFLADIRRHHVTYMNYVGKPLALVLATPERPDDADNTLRVAFGNEATDRDIDEFARRFGCRVVDSFGSSEFAVIVTREDGTPDRVHRQGISRCRRVQLGNCYRMRTSGFRRARCAGQLRRGGRGTGEHRGRRCRSPGTTTTRRPPASGCATACTGPAIWRIGTPTAGSTWPVAPRIGYG